MQEYKDKPGETRFSYSWTFSGYVNPLLNDYGNISSMLTSRVWGHDLITVMTQFSDLVFFSKGYSLIIA